MKIYRWFTFILVIIFICHNVAIVEADNSYLAVRSPFQFKYNTEITKNFALEKCKHELKEVAIEIERTNNGEGRLKAFYGVLEPFIQSGILLEDPEEVRLELQKQGIELNSLLSEIMELERKILALKVLKKDKYGKDKFVKTVALPDKEEGYIVETLGFSGKWRIGFLMDDYEKINRGGVLRLTKSLAYITERITKRVQQIDTDSFTEEITFKDVFIVDSFEDINKVVPQNTTLYEVSDGLWFRIDIKENTTEITAYATRSYLKTSRVLQRRNLRYFFEGFTQCEKKQIRGDNEWHSNIEQLLNKEKKINKKRERKAFNKTIIFLTDKMEKIGYVSDVGKALGDRRASMPDMLETLFSGGNSYINPNYEIWIEKEYIHIAKGIMGALRRALDSPRFSIKVLDDISVEEIVDDISDDIKVEVNCRVRFDGFIKEINVPLKGPRTRSMFDDPIFEVSDDIFGGPRSSDLKVILTRIHSGKDMDAEKSVGVHLLKEAIERKGYHTLISSGSDSFEYSNVSSRNIYCLSQVTDNINVCVNYVKKLRDKDPNAFIILGGPAAFIPEHIIANMPEVDILIRGEAENVLPEVIEIIADVNNKTNLSDEQLERLSSFDGVFVQSGRRLSINNLDKTNFVEDIKVPITGGLGKVSAVRGCPFNCSFCSKYSGSKYRSAPLNTMIDHLVGELAISIDLPSGIRRKIMAMSGAIGINIGSMSTSIKRNNYFPRIPFEKWVFSNEDAIFLLEIFHGASINDDYLTNWKFAFDQDTITQISHILGLSEITGLEGLIEVLKNTKICVNKKMLQNIVFIFRLQLAKELIKLNEKEDGKVLRPCMSGYLERKIEVFAKGDEMLGAKKMFMDLARWMIDNRFNDFIDFGTGQSSIASIYDFKKGRPDVEYLKTLRKAGIRLSSFGIDGATNTVLREHGKSRYTIGQILECYVAAERIGLNVQDINPLTFNPYTTEQDIGEAAALIPLLPFWGEKQRMPSTVRYFIGNSFGNDNIILYPDGFKARCNYLITGEFPEYDILEEHKDSLVPVYNRPEIIKDRESGWYYYEYEDDSKKLFNIYYKEIVSRWEHDTDPEMQALARLFNVIKKRHPGNLSPWEVIENIKKITEDIPINETKNYGYFRHLAENMVHYLSPLLGEAFCSQDVSSSV